MKKSARFCRTLVVTAVVAAMPIELPRAHAQDHHAQEHDAQDQRAQANVAHASVPQIRVIEVLADHDSRYKIAGERIPEITVRAGEQVLLRVTARRGKTWNRDGSIHGFSLLRAKDRTKVEGWDLLFKPGTQEFQLTAPAETGEYIVVCTVICSEDHEGMHMKFTVLP